MLILAMVHAGFEDEGYRARDSNSFNHLILICLPYICWICDYLLFGCKFF